jgi:hypothetical protein
VRSNRPVLAPGSQHRDRKRRPFGATAPLLDLAFPHHARIETDARIVDEHAPVDLADVDVAYLTRSNRGNRPLEVNWKPEILGEVIQRTHGQDPHRGVHLNRDSGHGADRPVTPCGHKHVATRRGLPRPRRKVPRLAHPLESHTQSVLGK